MGRKCSVEGCLSDSNRLEDIGVTFHKVPMPTEVRSKWFSLCHIPEEKKSIRVIYVCSRHFLRADFCSFKGKKYLLRQGVFPSVFPWDKSKLEAIKSEKHKNTASTSNIKPDLKEVATEKEKTDIPEVKQEVEDEKKETKDDNIESVVEELKIEDKTEDEDGQTESITFAINNRIHALDFNNKWYPAKIMEIDENENEVLIHFENNANEYDEWICMDSPRLKPFNSKDILNNQDESITTEIDIKQEIKNDDKKTSSGFSVGERCLAYWSGRRKLIATVSKVLEEDTFEVLFDDGHSKTLKSNRLIKIHENHQASPLFDPITSSKQDRRDRKRKLNVAELFGISKNISKKQKSDSTSSPKSRTPTTKKEPISKIIGETENWLPDAKAPSTNTADEVLDNNGKWLPRWIDGHPVGIESQLELKDGVKKTYIVPDPRIPEGWAKHLMRRYNGMGPIKWETIIVSPDGKKLRSRTDIKNYLESTKLLPYDENMFDFSMCKPRQRKSLPASEHVKKQVSEIKPMEFEDSQTEVSQTEEENEYGNLLKIHIIDDAYQCPIEGCGKNFRKENLAQMHVKHYHPEYSKFLDTTPNVADLAYARTVGDSLDKSPIHTKSFKIKTSTPKPNQSQSPCLEETEKTQSPIPSKNKDSEIIKLLNTKPYDSKSEGEPLPSGLPPNMYPDIKLKDLLSKSEGIPKRDDINLRTLSTTRPPVGIKTLLPVRKDNKNDDNIQENAPKVKSRNTGKRRKAHSEQIEQNKTKEIKEEIVPEHQIEPIVQTENSNVIIEGGQIIKIVRMKQEEIINCTCGYTEEDGLMIQCELCLCWQHAYCNNIQKESEVPDKYICYICQNPLRQRSSRKYFHDQDWLKQGTLPVGSYHAKDEELLQNRFEKLKKSHDISGGLVELQEFVNTLNIKLKIAEAKNHPKLYLWSKPWEKLPLPENMEEDDKEEKVKEEMSEEKLQIEEENQLNKDLKSLIENQPQVPIIPQPEAAIDTADCRLNLLDHILHSQDLVMERLTNFEKQLDELEENCPPIEKDEDYPKTRQTLQMLMRDLSKLDEFSQNTY